MSIALFTIGPENRLFLKNLMLDYYRVSDPDESDAMLEAYADTLLELLDAEVLDCRLALEDSTPIGFTIFTKDRKGTDFTELPGYGTIMELFVLPEYRHKGIGTHMVEEAEALLRQKNILGCYICAHESSAPFWAKLGYADSGEKGTNDLPLWIKK